MDAMPDPSPQTPAAQKMARHRRGVSRKLDALAEDLAELRREVQAAIEAQRPKSENGREQSPGA